MKKKMSFIFILMPLILFPIHQGQCRELKDFTGERVHLKDQPMRVVTLAPSLGELAADLLGNQLERIVGVSEFSDDPPALKKIENIGAYHRFNLEKVISLKPDLILATLDGNSKDQILSLRQRNLPVIVLSTQSFQQIKDSMLLMAQALGEEKSGQILVNQFQQGLDHFLERAKKRTPLKVLIQLNDEPMITAGKKSFLNEAVQWVGAKNLYSQAEATYPKPSLEDVIQKDPDVILILAFTSDARSFAKIQKKWAHFSKMKAVRDDRVLVLQSDQLLRPTLRMLEGLSLLENQLYGKAKK